MLLTFRPELESLELRDCPSVTAPTGLNLSALSSTQVKMTWNDVAGEQGYRIFEWDGTKTTLVNSVAANTTAFTVGSLAPLHQYYFSVEAFDASTTARSAWASVSTLPDSIAAPTNVKIVASTLSTITLSWNPSTNATGYRVYQSSGAGWTQVGSNPASTTSFKATNLTAGTTYFFQVQAFNATNSAMSAVITGATQAVGVTAPGNFQVKALNSSSIQLNWTDAVGENGYRVYRWDGVAPSASVLTTLAANTTSYQDSSLQPGKTYWYYVQAFNGNNAANTPWLSATTPAAATLTAPTNFKITQVGAGTALLTWSASAGAAGYHIYLWNGFTWQMVTTVPQGTQQTTIGGLGTNVTRWFIVQAYTADNQQFANSAPMFVNL